MKNKHQLKQALVLLNGDKSDVGLVKKIADKSFIICADGGVRHIIKLGLIPQVIVGDNDSIERGHKQKLISENIEWIKYPTIKNKTDGQLALELAINRGFNQIYVAGFFGDRLDHMFSNLFLIAKKAKNVPTIIIEGKELIFFVTDKLFINVKNGCRISLLPISGSCYGVTTNGLLFPLNNETLFYGDSRGISNQSVGKTVEIILRRGRLAVFVETD